MRAFQQISEIMRLVTLLLCLNLISNCYGDQKEDTDTYISRFVADLWVEGADVVRIIWRDCSKKLVDVKDVIDHKEYFPKFVRCMKRKTLRALDRSLTPDIVPLADGVNLVRFELVDRSGNIMPDNETRLPASWSSAEPSQKWQQYSIHDRTCLHQNSPCCTCSCAPRAYQDLKGTTTAPVALRHKLTSPMCQ